MRKISIKLGERMDGSADIRITPEQLFGCHCAILGSSGSGKSWTLARCLEESAKYGSKLVLLDVSGEFSNLNHRTFHIHIPTNHTNTEPSNTKSVAATMPYYELTESDLFSIFAPDGALQRVKLREAMRTLKLLQRLPQLAVNGVFPKSNKHKTPYEEALIAESKTVDRPDSIFNVFNLPSQIALECVEPSRGEAEQDYWGPSSTSDQTKCAPLIQRIDDILKQGSLNCIFNPPAFPSIFEALEKFITDDSVAILRISLEHLPLANGVRTIILEAIARTLLSMARNNEFRTKPVVLVMDEAHQAIGDGVLARQPEIARFPIFESIAKEGRKYGLTLCLATQRPSDLADGILTQMSTFIVHRLIGRVDQESVHHVLGGLDTSLTKNLSKLPKGGAILISGGLHTLLRVTSPDAPPTSHGPNYQQAWASIRSPGLD
jgi:hypothetical protein